MSLLHTLTDETTAVRQATSCVGLVTTTGTPAWTRLACVSGDVLLRGGLQRVWDVRWRWGRQAETTGTYQGFLVKAATLSAGINWSYTGAALVLGLLILQTCWHVCHLTPKSVCEPLLNL